MCVTLGWLIYIFKYIYAQHPCEDESTTDCDKKASQSPTVLILSFGTLVRHIRHSRMELNRSQFSLCDFQNKAHVKYRANPKGKSYLLELPPSTERISKTHLGLYPHPLCL